MCSFQEVSLAIITPDEIHLNCKCVVGLHVSSICALFFTFCRLKIYFFAQGPILKCVLNIVARQKRDRNSWSRRRASKSFSNTPVPHLGNLGRRSKAIKWLWRKLVVLPREAYVEDADQHLDEDEVDHFPRQPARPVLLASLMACAPRGTFWYTFSVKKKAY